MQRINLLRPGRAWVALAMLAFCGAESGGAQEFRSFVGEQNTLWESPDNWNPNDVPDSAAEGARVEDVVVVVGGNHTIHTLEMKGSGGLTLSQNNVLTVSSLVYDGTGVVAGPGTLIMNQSGTINTGTFSGGTFRNLGTLNLLSGLTLTAGAVFENVNTTELMDNTAVNAPGGAIVTNTGFIWKMTGSGIANWSAPVDNQLEISSRSGTLRVNGGGTSSGRFYTTNGTTLEFRTLPFTLSDGASVFGDGETKLTGSRFTLDSGATVDFDNFTLAGGTLDGSGRIVFSGSDNRIENGTLAGNVTSVITNGAVVTIAGPGNGTMDDDHRIIVESGGTLLLQDSGARLVSNGSPVLENRGTLDFAENGDLTVNSGSAFVITNTGAIIKSGGSNSAGDSLVQADLTHRGTFEVQSGVLRLQGHQVFEAPVTIQPGARLRILGPSALGGSTVLLQDGASFSGGGVLDHAGAVIEVATNARVQLDGYQTTLSGGRVTGAGTFAIGTSGTIDEIRHSGSGVTEIPAGVTVTTGSIFDLQDGRMLRNLGTLEVASDFSSVSSGGVTIENSGILKVTGKPSLSLGSGDFTIQNDGTWLCQIPANQFASFPPTQYSGDGTLRVETGKLKLLEDVALSGTIEVLANAELHCLNLSFAPGSVLQGRGKLVGNVNFAGTVRPGLSIGTLTVSGNGSFTSGGLLDVELGNGTNDQLLVGSTLDLTGADLKVSLETGYTPTPGTTWTIATANNVAGTFTKVIQTPALGFGFFVSYGAQSVTVTYSEVSGFAQAWEAATGQSSGSVNLLQVAGENLDNDPLPNLLDWVFGGSLSAPDLDRKFELRSVSAGDPRILTMRYPLNTLATDVTLAVEGATEPGGSFSVKSHTLQGTEEENGILYQWVTVSLPASDPARFFRLRATLNP